MVSRPMPRRDERVEQIAQDPEGYFQQARRRALEAAERDVAEQLRARRKPRLRRRHAA